MNAKNLLLLSFGWLAGLALTGCKKYLDLPLPLNTIAGSSAFANDKSSAAVLNGVYSQLIGSGEMLLDGTGPGYRGGLYTDELQSIGAAASSERVFYQNTVQSAHTGKAWTFLYKQLYPVNLAVEGLRTAPDAAVRYHKQWLGEAYFLRALLHFFLVNQFGDALIATSSDYRVNNTLPRSAPAAVYEQIITDLQQAQELLTDDYKNNNGLETTERVRPNKGAATALLARVYLYTGDWAGAEAAASQVIAQTIYTLPPPAGIFLKASPETIYAMVPLTNGWVRDYNSYNAGMPVTIPAFPVNGVNVALSAGLSNAFEAGDKRLTSWTRTVSSTTGIPVTYRFPHKYQSNVPGAEHVVVLRLAEQYLIRAEARAQQSRLTGSNSAQEDLDAVRARAGLAGTTATSLAAMLNAIIQERRVELFTEQGHRWYDLRRTGRLDTLMTALTPLKGGIAWKPFMQWWPINADDLIANPNLKQTEGYQ
jgi:hypothetical protein